MKEERGMDTDLDIDMYIYISLSLSLSPLSLSSLSSYLRVDPCIEIIGNLRKQ